VTIISPIAALAFNAMYLAIEGKQFLESKSMAGTDAFPAALPDKP
jgi:hypothetical protein